MALRETTGVSGGPSSRATSVPSVVGGLEVEKALALVAPHVQLVAKPLTTALNHLGRSGSGMVAAVQAGTGLAADQAARAQPCLQQGGAMVQVARTAGAGAGEQPAALGRHGGRGAVLVSLG
jgi:hypothetical protein